MDGYRDLRQVLTALRAGRVDPARLAEVGLGWSPEAAVPFWDFLVEHGVVAPDPARGALPATAAWQPTPRTEETSSLAGDGSTPEFRVPADPARDTVASGEPANGSATPGPSASRYEVLRPHRAGGLGEVWLARDTAVGREVALKTLRPDRLADPNLRARFVREARTTGQLEHPCVVPLYDLMPDVAGRGPCYVMRFVAGRTLAEAVADYHARRAKGAAGRLDLTALLDAFVAVCRAVAFAHARGVLHRDLKGQNVVLGDFGEVFLLDWGLAKSVGDADVTPSPSPEPADADELTRAGAVIGTPAYMAPEVAAGGPASPASDVYSLGAMMYAVLTGRPPYAGTTAVEVADKVKSTDPPPPRAVVPDAPPALEAVCRKAMARDPARRYASADELATEVRRWLADEPVAAYRDPWTVRATRWARRHRTPVAAAAVFLFTALVALSASTALVWREERRTADQKRLADEDYALARDLSYNGIEFVESAQSLLSSSPDLMLARKHLLAAGARAFRHHLQTDPADPAVAANAAQVFQYAAHAHRLENEFGPAEELYQDAERVLDGLIAADADHPAYRERLAAVLRDHAVVKTRHGKQREAAELQARAGKLLEELRATAPDDRRTRRSQAALLLDRSAVEYTRGLTTESRATAAAAVELYKGLGAGARPLDHLLLAAALTQVAVVDRDAGRLDAARALHAEAVKVMQGVAQKWSAELPSSDLRHFESQARFEQALTWARDPSPKRRANAETNLAATALQWKNLATTRPRVLVYAAAQAVALRHLGEVRAAVGKTAAARADFDLARRTLEGLVDRYPDVPGYRAELGRVYAGLGRAAPAGDPTRADWLAKAAATLSAAAAADPDNALTRRALDEVRAEADR